MTDPSPTNSPEAPSYARLKWLRIHRFRNVRPGTEIHFDDEWNLLLGKNGTGKTTLLVLLEALMTGDLEKLGRRPLHVEYEIQAGQCTLTNEIEWYCGVWTPAREGALARSQSATRVSLDGMLQDADNDALLPFDIRIRGSVEHATGEPETSWHYQAPAPEFEVRRQSGVFTFNRRIGVEAYGAPIPGCVVVAGELTPRLREYLELDELRRVTRLDEALDYYSELLGWSASIGGRRNDSHWSSTTEGFPWYSRVMRECFIPIGPKDIKIDSGFSWSRDQDSVLAEFETLTDAGNIQINLPLERYEVNGDEILAKIGPARLKISRPDGTLFYGDDLSFGQKRLFAFLHYIESSPIVLADELSNGMHRDWLDRMVEKMRGRQNIIAAQNPLILDRIGFTDAEQMQRTLILCRLEDGQFVWENISADDAHEVYRAYEVGLQNASEILWQKGLW